MKFKFFQIEKYHTRNYISKYSQLVDNFVTYFNISLCKFFKFFSVKFCGELRRKKLSNSAIYLINHISFGQKILFFNFPLNLQNFISNSTPQNFQFWYFQSSIWMGPKVHQSSYHIQMAQYYIRLFFSKKKLN